MNIIDNKIIFTNNHEEYVISNSICAFQIKEDVISDNYLNASQAIHLYCEIDYSCSVCIETKINYRRI